MNRDQAKAVAFFLVTKLLVTNIPLRKKKMATPKPPKFTFTGKGGPIYDTPKSAGA